MDQNLATEYFWAQQQAPSPSLKYYTCKDSSTAEGQQSFCWLWGSGASKSKAEALHPAPCYPHFLSNKKDPAASSINSAKPICLPAAALLGETKRRTWWLVSHFILWNPPWSPSSGKHRHSQNTLVLKCWGFSLSGVTGIWESEVRDRRQVKGERFWYWAWSWVDKGG